MSEAAPIPELCAEPERAEELSARLEAVRKRLRAAAETAGRDVPELIVVTKNFPPSDAAALARLGVRQMGENRDQEARAKADLLRAGGGEQPQWHFIGQLQTNKAKSVVTYASVVHSVDRAPLVTALDKAMGRALQEGTRSGLPETLGCLVQVSLDAPSASGEAPPHRGGASGEEEIEELAQRIADAEHLSLMGVMAVAPLGADPHQAFGQLAEIHGKLVKAYPGAAWISAGMSQDLEAAVLQGATHVRIGSDVLGPRTSVR